MKESVDYKICLVLGIGTRGQVDLITRSLKSLLGPIGESYFSLKCIVHIIKRKIVFTSKF